MRNFKLFIGSGFGSGLIPIAPGTFGSLAAVLLLYPVLMISPLYGVIVFVITSSLLSYWTSNTCEEAWGKDPGNMVIDEFAGQAIVFISLSLTPDLLTNIITLLIGFILFRFFDILKPLGINKVQSLGGATGILADDLIAGFYAFICLKTLIFMFPNFFGVI